MWGAGGRVRVDVGVGVMKCNKSLKFAHRLFGIKITG